MSNEFDATLDRIDLQKTRVVRTVRLGSSPRGMVVAGSGVWVAARPFPSASHRGGTLTVADTYLPDPPDPAAVYSYDGTLTAVYDGLTAFRRSGGAAGLTLVPDLAKTLPRPTAGGTTYTFTLRRGIRYSNGNLVRASDFRRGMQRQLSFGLGPAYYEGILGGSACIKHPNRCDLSAGIVTDDADGQGHLPPGPGGPRFPLQARAAARRARTTRHAQPHHRPGAVPARHRPLHDLATPAAQILHPRAQPVLPAVVIRRAADRIPVCHPVRAGEKPERAGIGGHRRPGRPGVPRVRRPSVSGHPVSGPHLFRPQTQALHMPLSTPASRRSRTSRPARPSTTPSTAPGSCSSPASPPVRPP